jgi:hypothetical protein
MFRLWVLGRDYRGNISHRRVGRYEEDEELRHVSRRMFRLWVLGRDYRGKVLYIGHRRVEHEA